MVASRSGTAAALLSGQRKDVIPPQNQTLSHFVKILDCHWRVGAKRQVLSHVIHCFIFEHVLILAIINVDG